MNSNRLMTPALVALTLPIAIFICRGRTIEKPRSHPSQGMLLAARLKERATLQAQRHENTYSIRLHKHASLIVRERV